MKKSPILILLILMTVTIFQQAFSQLKKSASAVTTREREISSFTGIVASGAFNLILNQAGQCSIKIETEENLQEIVKTFMDGKNLKIDILEDQRKPKVLNVYVGVNNLSSLVILGSIILKADSVLNCNELTISAGGTTISDIKVIASKIDMDAGDAAVIKVAGNCEYLKIRASDDSEIDAFGLQSEICKMRASGFSDVKLNVVSEIEMMVTGGGNVYYTGEPAIKNRIFAGSGFIVKRRN